MISHIRILLILLLSLCSIVCFSQTSWKGSTSWAAASNRTAGISNSATDSWLNIGGNNKDKDHDNYIYWSTASESNNRYFVVEASTDSANFKNIGTVNGNGYPVSVQNYSFLHHNIKEPVYYYRVKQVDTDGRYSYSSVIKIVTGTKLFISLSLLPNPVKDQAKLILIADKTALVSVMITTMNGQLIYNNKEKLLKGSNRFTIDLSGRANAAYILKVTDDNGYNEIMRFVKK